MKAMQTLITGCSQIVTMAGPPRPRVGGELNEIGLIEDGAVLLEDGLIVAVGCKKELESLIHHDARVVDVEGRVVTPGLVDAHTHPVFAGSRLDDFERRISGLSYAEIGALGGGIRSTERSTQNASEVELYDTACDRVEQFVKNGTTTIEAKSGYGGDLANELKMLRVLTRLSKQATIKVVPTFLGAHVVPEGTTASEHAKQVAEEMIPVIAKEKLAEYVDVFVEKGYYSVDDARLIVNAAHHHGLKARLHVDQLADGGGAALAASLKAKTADHLEHISDEGIQALKGSGTIPILLPGSVHCLGSHQYPPARKMIDAGLPVVIATDFNPGSSPLMSLTMAMNLACTQMRMTPAEALTACTINAAHSLDRGNLVGSLENGKQADFVVWDGSDYREIAYWLGKDQVNQVWIDGKLAFE